MDLVKDIKDFHEKFGLEYTNKPRLLPEELANFRKLFLEEEFKEYVASDITAQRFIDAEGKVLPGSEHDLATAMQDMLDSLVDLVYVALGTSYLHGFDFNEAWRRVHEANMAKVRAESEDQSKRGSTFDVIKPGGWVPPNHFDLVKGNVHEVEAE